MMASLASLIWQISPRLGEGAFRLEARPEDFFSLTYPTIDIRRVVERIGARFAGDESVPGLFLFEGLKGSGKSHLLLLAYHLFANPEPARQWLA
jgi:predicted AAA+ superfamily ATPase